MYTVGEFVLMNDEKVDRAIFGSLTRLNTRAGGVGPDAQPNALLAEYDRLGGFIAKNGLKVKEGSFFDFKIRKPRAEPIVSFILNVEGENIEGTEEEAAALKSARERAKAMKARKASSVLGESNTKIFDSEHRDDEPVAQKQVTKKKKTVDEE